ncbi:MAG: tRNA uridine-5-carboxymethylaminomethyl(34) synthesis enzyme MnmG [Nitrospirota bacterium]
MFYDKEYDIIVVGAGHAGCEAALASARMGCSVAIFTMNLDNIALMSCNPAIGGLAKSHIVKEIDALGGEMARNTDRAGIQFKVLNKSKGPAVWALRVQCDRQLYRLSMKAVLESQNNIDIKQGMVEKVIVEDGKVKGIETNLGIRFRSKALILTTGTFLRGLIHIGLTSIPAGRAGEFPSTGLSVCLEELGFKLGRLKTGTPPRLDAKTIDFSKTIPQYGDDPPKPFSSSTEKIINPQIPCYITYTNPMTHRIIKENLDRSPLYTGRIHGIGPRYCPSIEDKVVRFADKERHQIFLEPEGLETKEYYANGISTSLPVDVQIALIRSIPGLEEAEMMRPGYAIEYDFVPPTQLKPGLETKLVDGLFHAGQLNGTSGYEEAAAQGLMAGINAALMIQGREPLILGRAEAYIGVMIDDLVTKGTKEPYRMFTSRAEYRLILRQDNADLRLREKGYRVGLFSEEEYSKFIQKKRMIEEEIIRLKETRIKEHEGPPVSLSQILKRPEVCYEDIERIYPSKRLQPSDARLQTELKEQVEIQIKYEGYIKRQMEGVERFRRLEEKKIPYDFNYRGVKGLSKEVIEKLEEVKPISIGQAGRISGVTPAALSILLIALEKSKREETGNEAFRFTP